MSQDHKTLTVGATGWTEVRIDTEPDADGWCFCTPRNHPDDIERGLVDGQFRDRDQFWCQVRSSPTVQAT